MGQLDHAARLSLSAAHECDLSTVTICTGRPNGNRATILTKGTGTSLGGKIEALDAL
jgi:hypothetical protein